MPAGYQIYHIRGIANYTASTANASMYISYTNATATQYVRRLNLDAGGITYEEFNYTDGHLIIFGTGATLAKSAGAIALNMTVIRRGTQVRTLCQWHHSGVQSCGYTTMEGVLSSNSDAMTLAFVSAGRTFNNIRISVTGIRED